MLPETQEALLCIRFSPTPTWDLVGAGPEHSRPMRQPLRLVFPVATRWSEGVLLPHAGCDQDPAALTPEGQGCRPLAGLGEGRVARLRDVTGGIARRDELSAESAGGGGQDRVGVLTEEGADSAGASCEDDWE